MGIKIPGITGSAVPPELVSARHEPQANTEVRPEARSAPAPEPVIPGIFIPMVFPP